MADDAAAPAGGTAAEYAESLEEPVLEIDVGDITYKFVGRILSIEEWVAHWERRLALEALAARAVAAKTPVDMQLWLDHWKAFLRAVFPRRRFRWWAPDPVRLAAESPGLGLRGHYERHFFLQAVAMGAALPPPAPSPTPGPSSSSSTPDASAAA